MEFYLGGKTQTDYIDPEDRDLGGNGYYAFTCELNAIQMAEPIEVMLRYEKGFAFSSYSVKKYVEEFEAKKGDYDESTIALVHAIADYGHYAQKALSLENGWKIGKDYAEMDTHFTDKYDVEAVKEATAPYQLSRTLEDSKAKAAPVALNLLSKTELRVTAEYEGYGEGDVTATIDGAPAEVTYMGEGRFMAQTEDISAHLLDEEHVVCFTTKTGTVTVATSPLGYIHEVLEKSSKQETIDAVCALYHYYKATKEYRDAHGY